MDETDAVEALSRQGLSTYEARVFIALQKLGHGTASDIADITDVPRSQVYGAADALEDRGLIEVQHGTPLRYRPIDPTEAETRLRAPLEAERDRAIDYLKTVRGTVASGDEQQAEIWTVHGSNAIDDRLTRLADDATNRMYLGIDDPDRLTTELKTTLADRAAADVSVTLVSANDAVFDHAPTTIRTKYVPPELDAGDLTTRVLVADGNAVLLAINDNDDTTEESAIWSGGTGFSAVLARVVEAWFETMPD